MDEKSNYQSGVASLFAMAARQQKAELEPMKICWWCLEFGTGGHVSVFGTKVLANHSKCRCEAEEAEKARRSC